MTCSYSLTSEVGDMKMGNSMFSQVCDVSVQEGVKWGMKSHLTPSSTDPLFDIDSMSIQSPLPAGYYML